MDNILEIVNILAMDNSRACVESILWGDFSTQTYTTVAYIGRHVRYLSPQIVPHTVLGPDSVRKNGHFVLLIRVLFKMMWSL